MKEQTFMTPMASCMAAAVLTLMLGVIDWASGYELQFFVFYFVPIAFAAWNCGAVHSYTIAVLSAVVWAMADSFSGHPYTHWSYAVWNTAIRLASFLLIGFTIARLRDMLQAQYKISEELRNAMSEVKTLTGLLPICAECKKIRNDKGYWLRLEEYIEKNTSAQFTHGLCQECAAKTLAEVGIKAEEIEQLIGTGATSDTEADNPNHKS